MTKWQLFALLTSAGYSARFVDSQGKQHVGYLSAIQREDGSGHSFNVTIQTANGSETFHVRTED